MKTLIESCFCLDIKQLKKDLRQAREQKIGVNGFINIVRMGTQSVVDYRLECGADNDYLIIRYGEEEQRVKFVESELHFGPRSWFVCDCGSRVGKLYLPLHATHFKCRYCHNLYYQTTTINTKSKHGKFIYQQSRVLKLMSEREKIGRIFYRSRYTKRFIRWLGLCGKAGLTEEIKEANRLMAAING